jgi:dolichol-phosphate mannosyltransferase
MDLSIVIPFYNEEENIEFVLNETVEVLRPTGKSFEIITVDDGSRDRTPEILQKRKADIPELKILRHERNRGQGVAFWTAFEAARGEVIVTLDGDGQNDVHDVPRMLEALKGHDAVMGQRLKRKDGPLKRWASKIAYHSRRIILKDNIRDTACALKVMRAPALKALLPFRGYFRFIPFLLEQAGFSYVAVEVNHRPRQKGTPKYNLRTLFFSHHRRPSVYVVVRKTVFPEILWTKKPSLNAC